VSVRWSEVKGKGKGKKETRSSVTGFLHFCWNSEPRRATWDEAWTSCGVREMAREVARGWVDATVLAPKNGVKSEDDWDRLGSLHSSRR
jgi:hypothetical protein